VFAATVVVHNLITANNPEPKARMEEELILKPVNKRTLVILIDALRKDIMFSDKMPFLSNLRNRGAWGISKMTSVPVTIAGDHAIFSGTIGNFSSIFEYFLGSSSTYDNIFNRITSHGKRAVILSSASLRSSYGKFSDLTAFTPRHFSFGQYREDASYLFREAYRFLKEEKWDFAVVQFLTLDYLGHLETPLSPNYSSILKVIDGYIRKLVNLTTDQDIILITSEHGMDDQGFHADYTPEIIDTPFILLGPLVKKGGPNKIMQIDLAPTLSILAGVSPIYDSPALPALDLFEFSDKTNSIILHGFSPATTGVTSSLSLKQLRKMRQTNITIKKSPFNSMLIIFATLITMILLSHIVFSSSSNRKNTRFISIQILGVITCILVLGIIRSFSGILDYVTKFFPFSANFILTHPFRVILSISLLTTFSVLCLKYCFRNNHKYREFYVLFLFILIFAGAFLSINPYHPLNWIILCFPLIVWGISQRTTWLVVFGSVTIGLLIRRLTFYKAYINFNFTERWFLTLVILVACSAFLFWKLYPDSKKIRYLGLEVLCFIPGIIIMALSSNVLVNGILLLLCLIPVVFLNIKEPKLENASLALWVTFYYLGTSGSINHATHIIALPLFLAILSYAKGTTAVNRGIMLSFVFWVLYLLPGNSFDLKILELSDSFIQNSAIHEQISITVLLIASRYIFPVTILFWALIKTSPHISKLSLASAAFLPIVCGLGLKLSLLNLNLTNDIYSDQLSKVIVLFVYFLILLSAFLIVGLISFFKNLLHHQSALVTFS